MICKSGTAEAVGRPRRLHCFCQPSRRRAVVRSRIGRDDTAAGPALTLAYSGTVWGQLALNHHHLIGGDDGTYHREFTGRFPRSYADRQ